MFRGDKSNLAYHQLIKMTHIFALFSLLDFFYFSLQNIRNDGPNVGFVVLFCFEIQTYKVKFLLNLSEDDAMEFRPERFEHENFKSIHPYCYLRFLLKFKLFSDIKYEDLKTMNVNIYNLNCNSQFQLYWKISHINTKSCWHRHWSGTLKIFYTFSNRI